MVWLMLTLILMLGIMQFRYEVGNALNVVLYPVLGFGGDHVVVTLVLTAMMMMCVSTIIRTLMTDTIKQTRSQKEMSAFNAELRQARIENNLYKIKKLTEMQNEMMSKSMESSMSMMKTMPITMLIIIPIFAWLNYFISYDVAGLTVITIPWGMTDIAGYISVFPKWILVYMLITIPFAQIIGRLIRWYKFSKRLAEIDAST
jgi:uncharacterized membrane protein (DUF106 family)